MNLQANTSNDGAWADRRVPTAQTTHCKSFCENTCCSCQHLRSKSESASKLFAFACAHTKPASGFAKLACERNEVVRLVLHLPWSAIANWAASVSGASSQGLLKLLYNFWALKTCMAEQLRKPMHQCQTLKHETPPEWSVKFAFSEYFNFWMDVEKHWYMVGWLELYICQLTHPHFWNPLGSYIILSKVVYVFTAICHQLCKCSRGEQWLANSTVDGWPPKKCLLGIRLRTTRFELPAIFKATWCVQKKKIAAKQPSLASESFALWCASYTYIQYLVCFVTTWFMV